MEVFKVFVIVLSLLVFLGSVIMLGINLFSGSSIKGWRLRIYKILILAILILVIVTVCYSLVTKPLILSIPVLVWSVFGVFLLVGVYEVYDEKV